MSKYQLSSEIRHSVVYAGDEEAAAAAMNAKLDAMYTALANEIVARDPLAVRDDDHRIYKLTKSEVLEISVDRSTLGVNFGDGDTGFVFDTRGWTQRVQLNAPNLKAMILMADCMASAMFAVAFDN